MFWRLNRIQYPVYNLGEGKRIGIWVQGCSLACKDCVSETLQTIEGGKEINIAQLVDEIVKVKEHFNGITITGGEPFQQYQQLIAFCAYLKQKTGMEIYVFSGYYLEEIIDKFPDRLFFKYIDYLMDGRYEKDKHDNQNVRGSSNQNLYKFENNQAILQKDFFKSEIFSVNVDNDKQVYLSGIPKTNELNQLSVYLNKTGINLTFK